jgi:hypothetical protein
MTAVTFDTHKLITTLEAAGMPVQQAEAVSAAIRESATGADAVTRKDLQIELQKEVSPVKLELAAVRADIVLLKWMLGVVVAGTIALVMKAFLHS